MSRPISNERLLGAAIRERREDRGLTQAELSERAGVSRAFIIDIEKGARPGAELGRVLALVRALDAVIRIDDDEQPSFDELLGDIVRGQGAR